MKRFFLFLLLATATGRLSAQSLDECRRLAREHYPEIQQYDLIAQTEQYDLSNAARAWIPQVVLSGQATWQSDVVAFPDALSGMLSQQGVSIPGMRREQYKVAIDVSQTIWDGGQSKASRAITKAEAAEQLGRVDVTLYDVQSRVDDLYFGILLLDERAAQTEAMIVLLESNLDRMRAYCKNGVALPADADAVEAELLTARQTLAQINSSRESYRRMLALFIGRPLNGGRLEKPATCEVMSRTSAHPELALFDAEAAKLKAQRKAVKSSLTPRFSVYAQGYYGYPGLDMFESMVSPNGGLNAIVGVRMSWNIGAFYTKRNTLGKIDAAERRIEVQRNTFLFHTQLQIEQEDGEIARLRKALEDDDRIVALRRSVRMAAESKLKNGVIDATDLLRTITDETAAALSRSTREIELIQAIYRLKQTLNQ